MYAEAVLKFAKLNTASVASRSVCSRAKPTAHTGFGIANDYSWVANIAHTSNSINEQFYEN
jgi:hypothetical protein